MVPIVVNTNHAAIEQLLIEALGQVVLNGAAPTAVHTRNEKFGYWVEKLFAEALERLDYKRVGRTNALRPKTFRMTERRSQEDRHGVDAVVTLPRNNGRVQPSIPVQITMVWEGVPEYSVSYESLQWKSEGHEKGWFALFYPVRDLGTQKAAMEMLEGAARGEREHLRVFDEIFQKICAEFLTNRKQRIFNIATACLMREVKSENPEWKLLNELAPALADALKRESQIIKVVAVDTVRRERFVHTTLRPYREAFEHGPNYYTRFVSPNTCTLLKIMRRKLQRKKGRYRQVVNKYSHLLHPDLQKELRELEHHTGSKAEAMSIINRVLQQIVVSPRMAQHAPAAVPYIPPPQLAPDRRNVNLEQSVQLILSTRDEKEASRELDRIMPLLDERKRRRINRINRTIPRHERMKEVRAAFMSIAL